VRSILRVSPASPFAISGLLSFQAFVWFPLDNCAGVAELGTHQAKIADDNKVMIRMLENDSHRASGNTFTAIRAPDFVNDVGAGISPADGSLRTDLGALAALGADIRTVLPRVWKFDFDTKRGFGRVNFVEMLDGADLKAKAAACAFIPVDFNSQD